MINDKLIRDLYVEIDCLFDTRLPTLYHISPKIFEDTLRSGNYLSRKKDVFGIIPNSVFSFFYRRRGNYILNMAPPTPMLDFIRELSVRTKDNMISIGDYSPLNLYINTHPYKLTMEEINTLRGKVLTCTPVNDVIMVVYTEDELTPEWVNSNIGTMIIYNALNWVELHTANKAILLNPLPEVTLYTPNIIRGNIKSDMVTIDIIKKIIYDVKPLIDLSFIDSKEFSSCGLR